MKPPLAVIAIAASAALLSVALPAAADSWTHSYGPLPPLCTVNGLSLDCNATGSWTVNEAKGYISTFAAEGVYRFSIRESLHAGIGSHSDVDLPNALGVIFKVIEQPVTGVGGPSPGVVCINQCDLGVGWQSVEVGLRPHFLYPDEQLQYAGFTYPTAGWLTVTCLENCL